MLSSNPLHGTCISSVVQIPPVLGSRSPPPHLPSCVSTPGFVLNTQREAMDVKGGNEFTAHTDPVRKGGSRLIFAPHLLDTYHRSKMCDSRRAIFDGTCLWRSSQQYELYCLGILPDFEYFRPRIQQHWTERYKGFQVGSEIRRMAGVRFKGSHLGYGSTIVLKLQSIAIFSLVIQVCNFSFPVQSHSAGYRPAVLRIVFAPVSWTRRLVLAVGLLSWAVEVGGLAEWRHPGVGSRGMRGMWQSLKLGRSNLNHCGAWTLPSGAR